MSIPLRGTVGFDLGPPCLGLWCHFHAPEPGLGRGPRRPGESCKPEHQNPLSHEISETLHVGSCHAVEPTPRGAAQ